VKNKISRTLEQLSVIVFFNQTKQTVTKFKGLEKKRIINWTVWVNFNGYLLLQPCTIGMFSPIFLPSLHLNFFWF